jgi:peptidoglycan hydrolase-like protein with peptidoglycan-binding domain
MFNEDVLQVFDWVQLNTPVKISGPPHWTTKIWRRPLSGDCFGPDVVYVQLSLRKLGFYPSLCDGRYNSLTALAVRYFQASAGLAVTGTVDEATYRLLQEKGGIAVPPDPEA